MIEQEVRQVFDPINAMLFKYLPILGILILAIAFYLLFKKLTFSIKAHKFKKYDVESTNTWFVYPKQDEKNKKERTT